MMELECIAGRFKEEKDKKDRDQIWSRSGFVFTKIPGGKRQPTQVSATRTSFDDAVIEYENSKKTARLYKAFALPSLESLVQLLKLYLSPSELLKVAATDEMRRNEALVFVQCSIDIYDDSVVVTSALNNTWHFETIAAYAHRAHYWKRMKPKRRFSPDGVAVRVRLVMDSLTAPPIPAVQVPRSLYNGAWSASEFLVLRGALQSDMEYSFRAELQGKIVLNRDSFRLVDTLSLVRVILDGFADRARFFAENGLVYSGHVSESLRDFRDSLVSLIEENIPNQASASYIKSIQTLDTHVDEARAILQNVAYRLVAMKSVVGPQTTIGVQTLRDWVDARRAFWTNKPSHVSYPFRQWVLSAVYPLINGVLYNDWSEDAKELAKERAGLPWIHYLELAVSMQRTLLESPDASGDSSRLIVSRAFWPASHSRDQRQRGPDFDALTPGDRYLNRGFLATSYSTPPENFYHSDCCIMCIDVPRGFPCLLLQSTKQGAGVKFQAEYEKELLFPAGTTMEFVAFEMMRIKDNAMRVARFKMLDNVSELPSGRALYEAHFPKLYPLGYHTTEMMRSPQTRADMNKHLFGARYEPYEAAGIAMVIYGRLPGSNQYAVALGRETGGRYAGQHNLFGGRHDKARTRAETAQAEFNEEFAFPFPATLPMPELTVNQLQRCAKIYARRLLEPRGMRATTFILGLNVGQLPSQDEWNRNAEAIRANPAIGAAYKEMAEISYFELNAIRAAAHQARETLREDEEHGMLAERWLPADDDGQEGNNTTPRIKLVRVSTFAIQALLDFEALVL